MKKLLTLSLIFATITSNAQFKAPSEKQATQVIQRVMLVQLDLPSEKVLKKLKHNQEAQRRYKERVRLSNDILKASVDEYWNISREVRYGTKDELDHILSTEGENNFVILSADYETKEMRTVKTIQKRGGLLISLRLADKKSAVFEMMLPSDLLNNNDYKFILHTISKHIRAASQGENVSWNIDNNASTLAEKTLFVTKAQLSIDEDKAQKSYKNKLKIVTNDNLEDRIARGDTNTLFCINMLHMRKMIWMSVTVDAATMDVVSLVPSESFQFMLAVPSGKNDVGNNVLIPVASYRSRQGLSKKYFKYTTSKLAMRINH